MQSGNLRVASVVGDAGIGKSRLIHEFKNRLEESQFAWMEGHCTALAQGRAFHSYIDVVRRAFRIEPGIDEATRKRRLGQGLEMLGAPSAEHTPVLMTLLQGHPHEALSGLEDESAGRRADGVARGGC